MPLRLLKLKPTLPHQLEQRLINHWGFTVEKRLYGMVDSHILFKKMYISDAKVDTDDGVKRTIRASVTDSNVVPIVSRPSDRLKKFERAQLERRCDNVVSFFPDPYAVVNSVRMRLSIMQQNLSPEEADYVQSYMDENFPE